MTCEVSPHHLCLTDEAVRTLDASRYKMNPPLRTEADRQALIDALIDGTIDCIATDHAPHAVHEKEVPYEAANMGVTGLETAFSSVYTELVLPGRITPRPAGREARLLVAPRSESNRSRCRKAAGPTSAWSTSRPSGWSAKTATKVARSIPGVPGKP